MPSCRANWPCSPTLLTFNSDFVLQKNVSGLPVSFGSLRMQGSFIYIILLFNVDVFVLLLISINVYYYY